MIDPEKPNDPVKVIMAPLPWQTEVWNWVKKQGAVVVVLMVSTYVLWQQWQADRVAELAHQEARDRSHAETIRKISEEASAAVDKLASHQTEQLRNQAEIFRQEQDRTERILGNKINLNAQRMEDALDKLKQLEPQN